ncbi:MAG: SDR family NAD(P)-dependent oxidoreductase, partial [Bacteroidales bacterium]|nr:SDR family NAD(P)-dependent oxidoreductase [Bacteroidales bacterium]
MGWALVTGGSSGMGLEYARQLAARGYDLLLVSNQQAALEQAADDLHDQFGVRTMARYQDLSSVAAADELLAFCVAHSLEIEVLVNNAGMFFFEELHPENEAKALKMLQLHVYTPTRLCILFGEAMKHRGQGYILNVSSMAAKLPCPGIAVYSATKAYLKSFS